MKFRNCSIPTTQDPVTELELSRSANILLDIDKPFYKPFGQVEQHSVLNDPQAATVKTILLTSIFILHLPLIRVRRPMVATVHKRAL